MLSRHLLRLTPPPSSSSRYLHSSSSLFIGGARSVLNAPGNDRPWDRRGSQKASRHNEKSPSKDFSGGFKDRNLKGVQPATSSRRLSNFDKQDPEARPRENWRKHDVGYPSHKFRLETPVMPPNSKPQSYNRDDDIPEKYIGELPAYPTPPRLSTAEQAAPAPFRDFALEEGLIQSLEELYGPEGKTSPIETISFKHFTKPSLSSAPPGSQRVILGAETGSGKTMSYLIPLFHHLKSTDTGPSNDPSLDEALLPRALVLSPTHELTRQSTQFAKLLSHHTKLSVSGLSSTTSGRLDRRGVVDVLLGTLGSVRRGFGMRQQTKEQKEREDVIRGKTIWPDDEVREGLLKSEKVEWVVIDEADVLLGGDFYEDTIALLERIPHANLILCTATLPPFLLNLLSTHPFFHPSPAPAPFVHLLSPGLHKLPEKLLTRFVRPSQTGNKHGDVAHQVRLTLAEDAKAAKASGIKWKEGEGSKIVVFCNTDKMVEQVSSVLGTKKIDCLAWTGAGGERLRGRNGSLDDFLLRPSLPGRPSSAQSLALASDASDPQPGLEDSSSPTLSLEDETLKSPTLSLEDETPKDPTSSLEDETVKDPTSLPTPEHHDPLPSSRPDRNPMKPQPKRRVLVTTSLLSRGLDFHPSVSSVFLVQPPRDVLDFVHRAGRAGRAGRPGRVVVFGITGDHILDKTRRGPSYSAGKRDSKENKSKGGVLSTKIKDLLRESETMSALGKASDRERRAPDDGPSYRGERGERYNGSESRRSFGGRDGERRSGGFGKRGEERGSGGFGFGEKRGSGGSFGERGSSRGSGSFGRRDDSRGSSGGKKEFGKRY
ncbi:hypothetical protein L202_00016 [Cryptococcus amylolentus CBS 6039]|uniref:RNA helicase n=1 Tax=Cryptococcus amylolentus CBS 6039 TaxID=1295533 RepID=A0A1E3I5U8_9TREE|nr:hypothetical protein L202_00016 [Cryptococcus amylolentus CBS 6039]ODN83979.1 hypothetical protein L202_00016 [Cryptococcus amylolentus CBS 6039]